MIRTMTSARSPGSLPAADIRWSVGVEQRVRVSACAIATVLGFTACSVDARTVAIKTFLRAFCRLGGLRVCGFLGCKCASRSSIYLVGVCLDSDVPVSRLQRDLGTRRKTHLFIQFKPYNLALSHAPNSRRPRGSTRTDVAHVHLFEPGHPEYHPARRFLRGTPS